MNIAGKSAEQSLKCRPQHAAEELNSKTELPAISASMNVKPLLMDAGRNGHVAREGFFIASLIPACFCCYHWTLGAGPRATKQMLESFRMSKGRWFSFIFFPWDRLNDSLLHSNLIPGKVGYHL
jgi:hypothetical protein